MAHLLPALWSERGWHDAFSGRNPDKTLLYTGGLAVQAVLWNPGHSKVQDPERFSAVAVRTLLRQRIKLISPQPMNHF